MREYTPTTGAISIAYEDWMDYLGKPRAQSRAEFDRWLAAHDAEVRADEAAQWAQAVLVSGLQGERIGAARAGVVAEEPDIAALRAARAETWDEAISAVFAWWSKPDNERPAVIVNPYGLPVKQEGADT